MSELAIEDVAPYAGAWIEMPHTAKEIGCENVAPYAGAWIEIITLTAVNELMYVAPYAGAWIEIKPPLFNILFLSLSPLTQGRGLKYIICYD